MKTFSALLVFSLMLGSAFADNYPGKPIRIIVPYPPGGFNDTLARTLGQKLTEKWGQPVIVDNRPGGGTTIGANLAAFLLVQTAKWAKVVKDSGAKAE